MSKCPKCGAEHDSTAIHVCRSPGVNECPVEWRYVYQPWPWLTAPSEIRLSRTDRLCILLAGNEARLSVDAEIIVTRAEMLLAEIEKREAGK